MKKQITIINETKWKWAKDLRGKPIAVKTVTCIDDKTGKEFTKTLAVRQKRSA